MSKTSKKHHGSTSHKPRKATAADWISGARIRTLPLAFAPVAIGSGAAALTDQFKAPVALLCLVVAASDGDTLKARCGEPGAYEKITIRISAIDHRCSTLCD